MKKLALIAGAAALVFPVIAEAKDRNYNEANHSYTYKRVDQSASSHNDGAYRIEMQSEEDFRTNPANRVATFTTFEDEKLIIEGKTVYKVAANGSRFYAPNGSYMTRENLNVVVQDGQLDRIEEPATIVRVD
ncbi:MAG: hypothetical protein KA155_01830 [Alphaproteobacteria bacterium]|jgi:hypothetical protein|nr:hypothetical protein [Alphaproteobacteria bacterium]